MSDESQRVDPYEAVLADLKAKRDQIDQAIGAIEALRSGGPIVGSGNRASPVSQNVAAEEAGDYLGMTIADATRKLLATRRKALTNTEIVAALEAGGLVMTSADKLNTVGSILTRRFNQVGDIVRVARGTWGLQEWYGSRFKKKGSKAEGEQGNGNGATNAETSEPEQPSEQPQSVFE